MNRSPRVGISCDDRTVDGSRFFRLSPAYVHAILRAGGIPLLLPPVGARLPAEALLSGLDALVLTGSGPDLPPRLYGQRQRFRFTVMAPDRWRGELALARAAHERGMPLLGICGGMQLLNVAFGGSLIQDIRRQVPRALRHEGGARARHEVRLLPGSRISAWAGRRRLSVNSHHHQAVDRVAPGWRVTAVASDGIPEAIEDASGRPSLGVQWHPERMPDASEGLFRRFLGFTTR